jgi:hypothetical protein
MGQTSICFSASLMRIVLDFLMVLVYLGQAHFKIIMCGD